MFSMDLSNFSKHTFFHSVQSLLTLDNVGHTLKKQTKERFQLDAIAMLFQANTLTVTSWRDCR